MLLFSWEVCFIFSIYVILFDTTNAGKYFKGKVTCPKVKSLKNFDLEKLMGSWYVVQYYASSEEELAYRCMRAEFAVTEQQQSEDCKETICLEVSLNFSYIYKDDPSGERLLGNITWKIPDINQPAHWVHTEDIYKEIYNTYVVDSNYESWSLLLHCAEKRKSPRYLSSFIMSRTTNLPDNVISFLRDKLPRYDIDLEYMFPMNQQFCSKQNELHYAFPSKQSSEALLSTAFPGTNLSQP